MTKRTRPAKISLEKRGGRSGDQVIEGYCEDIKDQLFNLNKLP